MTSNPVLIKNIFFNSLLIFGLTYISFLTVFVHQAFSGFVMQFIFLVDTLKFHSSNFITFILSTDFLFNFFSGIFSFTLLILFFKSFLISLRNISMTRKYIKSLNIVSQKKYIVFVSSIPHAFTAGFLHPQIYISTKLLKISTPKEINAIYLHEFFHKVSFDSSKDLYINLLTDALPFLPFKNWFFGQYHLIKENCCDFFAQNKISDRKPLISALIKIHAFYTPTLNLLSHFSAQSERIKILTGKKTFHFFNPLSYSIFSVFFLILSINFVSQSELFYHCQHLGKCFEVFVSGQSHNLPSCHQY